MLRYVVSLTLLAQLSTGVALAASDAAAAGPAVDTASLLELTGEMERFLKEKVRLRTDERETVKALMEAILGPRGLALEYADSRTKTAAETFESRSGNCLSFTLLFVAMARHLGLNARFNEVMEVISWNRRGNSVWNSRHMIAEVWTPPSYTLVDFLPETEKRYRAVRRISDQRTLAHYFNNLGAEAFADGRSSEALEFFRKALAVDPTFAPAWVNQGAVYRRMGDDARSEESSLKALEVDPTEMTAASNLAQLYQATGREKEAALYRRMVQRFRQRNPFYHFHLGLTAVRDGDLEAAERHFKRAIRRRRNDPLFHAELAAVHLELDHPGKARRSLKKAIQHAEDEDRRRRLELRLQEIADTGRSR